MIRLGLTGSIGMGKSTTADMFRQAGVPVWDADAAVHRLYERGGAAVDLIDKAFPGSVKEGEVNRDALRTHLVGHPEDFDRLNRIVHPLVGQDRIGFIERSRSAGAPLAVFDIPLLYETGGERFLDAVIVVSAPEPVQRARVLARPGMTQANLNAILDRQVPDADKRARADFIIETGFGLDYAKAQVDAVIAAVATDRHKRAKS
jgi:dephospho-CoA kinase